MMSIDPNSFVILNINGVDYYCITAGITESGSINLLTNSNLSEKGK